MAASAAQNQECSLCDETLGPEVSSFKLSSKHELFHGHDNVKSVIKDLYCWEQNPQDSSVLDDILKDDDVICGTCFEKLGTCFTRQQQIEGARRLFRFSIREG